MVGGWIITNESFRIYPILLYPCSNLGTQPFPSIHSRILAPNRPVLVSSERQALAQIRCALPAHGETDGNSCPLVIYSKKTMTWWPSTSRDKLYKNSGKLEKMQVWRMISLVEWLPSLQPLVFFWGEKILSCSPERWKGVQCHVFRGDSPEITWIFGAFQSRNFLTMRFTQSWWLKFLICSSRKSQL